MNDLKAVSAMVKSILAEDAQARNDDNVLYLPRVVFHSLRHSSITYKLKLNGGDVKAVQGDSGHAQVKMVTDVYSHILDDDRRNNAKLFEEAFYSGAGKDPTKQEPEPQLEAAPAADVSADTATLLKLIQNPEMAALLKTLAKSL